MADPVTLAAISLAATVAGTGVSAYGANQKAGAESASASYQSAVAMNNKKIADQNATYALESGKAEAFGNQIKVGQTIGTQKAVQAASGTDVNSGSNVDVRKSTAEIGALDTLTILNNATKKAAGFQGQGMNFEADSGLYRAKAGFAKQAGDIGVTTSLLGGASSFSDKWLGYQQKGTF